MRSLNPNEQDLLNRIENKPELQPFFFQKVKGLHWFKPLYERGFFFPEKNPKPIPAKEEGYFIVPPWLALEYLVTSSKELSNTFNEDLAIQFLSLIRNITTYSQNEKYSNYSTWWKLTQVIMNIPSNLISLADMDLIEYWLNDLRGRDLIASEIGEKWLPSLIERQDEYSHELALRLLDILFTIDFVDKNSGFHKGRESILKYEWDANDTVKKIALLSGSKLGLPAVELFQNRLISILNECNNDKWSSIWRKAIKDHIQNGRLEDTDNVIISFYRDCLLGFVDYDLESAVKYLQHLFNSQYQTLKRIAISVVDQKSIIINDLIDHILVPDFFQGNYRHEIWHFLNNHFKRLNTEQQNKIIDIINNIKIFDDEKSIDERATAYKRNIWLSAIKDITPEIASIYNKYKEITGVEPEHPDFSSYFQVGWVSPKSPFPLEDLLNFDIDSLITTLNNYKDPGNRFREPSLEGLVKTFKSLVKVKAHEFYHEFRKFINMDLAFLYSLIEAYNELWTEKKEELPWVTIWPELLDFCLELISIESFWSEENAKERALFVANRQWVVGEIGRLIENGTASDDHAFDKALLPKAKQILLILLGKQEGVEFKIDSDAVIIAINSARGHCIEALISLTLRSCRLADEERSEHQEIWNEYQKIYDSELKRSEHGEYEFITLVGNHLPNFLYMSTKWLQDNLVNIFDYSNYQKWLCVMQGYAYVNEIYDKIYNFLKDNGDLLKALDDRNLKDEVKEKIIQNIVTSYNSDNESITNTGNLISILISRKNSDELAQLIWFFWTLYDKGDIKLKEKAFELWPRLLNIIDLGNIDGKKLASQLCHWSVFVEKINEITEKWLLKIAPYSEEDHNSYILLENLARLSESQALKVQKIWLAMLNSYIYPYPEESIKKILNNLILLGSEGESKAIEIVDAYLLYGVEKPRKWLIEIKKNDK